MKQPFLLKKRGSIEPGKSAKSIQDDLKDKKGSSTFELEDNRPETMAQVKLEAGLDEQKLDTAKDTTEGVAVEEIRQPIANDMLQDETSQSLDDAESSEDLKNDTTELVATEEKKEELE